MWLRPQPGRPEPRVLAVGSRVIVPPMYIVALLLDTGVKWHGAGLMMVVIPARDLVILVATLIDFSPVPWGTTTRRFRGRRGLLLAAARGRPCWVVDAPSCRCTAPPRQSSRTAVGGVGTDVVWLFPQLGRPEPRVRAIGYRVNEILECIPSGPQWSQDRLVPACSGGVVMVWCWTVVPRIVAPGTELPLEGRPRSVAVRGSCRCTPPRDAPSVGAVGGSGFGLLASHTSEPRRVDWARRSGMVVSGEHKCTAPRDAPVVGAVAVDGTGSLAHFPVPLAVVIALALLLVIAARTAFTPLDALRPPWGCSFR